MFLLIFSAVLPLFVATESQLILVHTIVRHGARAPIEQLTSDEAKAHFYRGLGQLTDEGIQQAKIVGELLRDRYINTSFVDKRMLPSENFFRSSPSERCLMTLDTIARVMYPSSSPPIKTVKKNTDTLLVPQYNCTRVLDSYTKIFNLTTKEQQIAKDNIFLVSGKASEIAAKNTTLLEGRDVNSLPALILEKDAGLAVPAWFNDTAHDEAEYLFYSALSAISGAGVYFDPISIKTKAGFLLHTIFSDINKMVICRLNGICDRKLLPAKLNVLSTHDIMILAIVEALGVRVEALEENKAPKFCATIVIETWLIDGKPKVKLFYRRHPQEKDLINLSPHVRYCDKNDTEFCSAEKFTNCCDEFVTTQPVVECYGQTTEDQCHFKYLPVIILGLSFIIMMITLYFAFSIRKTKAKHMSIDNSVIP